MSSIVILVRRPESVLTVIRGMHLLPLCGENCLERFQLSLFSRYLTFVSASQHVVSISEHILDFWWCPWSLYFSKIVSMCLSKSSRIVRTFSVYSSVRSSCFVSNEVILFGSYLPPRGYAITVENTTNTIPITKRITKMLNMRSLQSCTFPRFMLQLLCVW